MIELHKIIFIIHGFMSTVGGRIETKVWMTYSKEVASEPTKQKDIIDVGEFDLRRKRSPYDDVNPFAIRHSSKGEELAFLEAKLNKIRSRYDTIEKFLDSSRDKRFTFDDNLNYIEQLLIENDADVMGEVGHDKIMQPDISENEEISGKEFQRAFRQKRSFYHDSNVEEEVYRMLNHKCKSETSICHRELLYFNSSVQSLRDDALKQITKVIVMDVISYLLIATGSILTVVNLFMAKKIYKRRFATSPRQIINKEIYPKSKDDEFEENFSLPFTSLPQDIRQGEISHEKDIIFIKENMKLKKSNKRVQVEKSLVPRVLKIIVKKGFIF